MISILAVWLIVILSSAGYGWLWSKISRISPNSNFIDTAIPGFALLCSLSLLAGSFFALEGNVSRVILMIGVIAALPVLFESKPKIASIGLLIVFGVLAIRIAWPLATLAWSGAYDSDLYHFQQVRWLREQGTPLGLANLHIRLGVSTSFLSLAALLEQWGMSGRAAWFMPGILPLLGLIWLVNTVRKYWNSAEYRLLVNYCLVISPFMLSGALGLSPSLYFDSAVAIAEIILVGGLLRLFCAKNHSSESEVMCSLQNVFFLAALSITIKFSALALACLAVLLAIIKVRKFKKRLAVGAGLILSFHFVRTVMLTGWLLFPAPYGKLPVSWAMPSQVIVPEQTSHGDEMQTVKGHYEIVRAWARLPGAQYATTISAGLSVWLPTWLSIFNQTFEAKLLSFTIMLLMISLLVMRKELEAWLSIICLGLIPLVWWFITAPDLRFGGIIFWIFLAVTFAYLAKSLVPATSLAVLAALVSVVVLDARLTPNGWPTVKKIGKAQSREVKVVALKDGSAIFQPLGAGEDRCGNAKLPCTPYLQPELRIVKKGGRVKRIYKES